jgi:subtilisin family serine protease
VACFSNSSARLDLLAPGAGIVSADLGGGKANRSGTSQAAAVVTGAVALLLEGAPESGNRIGAALTGTGASITDMRNGRVTPRLDTRAALTALNH